MNSLIRPLCCLILLLAPATAATRADDEVKGLLKELQGEWSFQTEKGEDATWVFLKDKSTVTLPNGRKYVTSVTLDEKAKPITIDFKVEEGPDEALGKTVHGILKREDGKVVLAIAGPEKDRPTEFQAVEEAVFVFKLAKK